jgi:hypothetical protein
MKNIFKDNSPAVKRNFFLTILLILVILANIFVGVVYLLVILGVADGSKVNLPYQMIIFSFLVCVGNVICGFGMWNWRKWGLIGYAVIVLTAFVVTGIVTKDFSNFYGLVGLALLSILFYPYWKFMK